MINDMQKILLTEEQVQSKVKELAKILSEEYAGKDPVFVAPRVILYLFSSSICFMEKTPSINKLNPVANPS